MPIGISLDLAQQTPQQTPQKTSTKVDGTYAALQKYFVVKVIKCTELEVHQLQKEPSLQSCRSKDSGFFWNIILEFSVDAAQRVLMKVAPVMWMVLTSIAIGKRRSIQLKEANATDKKSGKGANHIHDPYLVSCTPRNMANLYAEGVGYKLYL